VTREQFEREFNSRTLAYHPDFIADDRAVVVAIGDQAHNEPNHALLITLANLLARAHRRLIFVGDLDQQLRCIDPLGSTTLRAASVERAVAINPFIDAAETHEIPATDVLLSIGIGCAADLRASADGWRATFGLNATTDPGRTSIIGASLAAALAANAAFHRQLGRRQLPNGSYSLWDYGRASTAQGPPFEGPVDVGTVLQAGAGAVACALDYWLSILGIKGKWTIVDGDYVDVSNLNRQMLFVAADAGFPTGTPQPKADIAKRTLGDQTEAEVAWIDESAARSERYDLILPLANERGVRKLLQMRPEPILLHAVTTPNWSTIVHRHIAEKDGCIVCRIPEQHDAAFTCATGQVGITTKQDASLPFLSAAAGALLLAEIARLQLGKLANRPANHGVLDLNEPKPFTTDYQFTCNEGCRVLPSAATREREAASTRWITLAKPTA
jgi:ThiF family